MRILLPLVLAWLLCSPAAAKEKVQVSPEPGWLFPTKADLTRVPVARTISNGYYYELQEEQTNLLTNTQYTHYIKQITNESGIQRESEVSVTYSPEFQELIIHTINILREGKVIRQLLPGTIQVVQEETDAADFMYNGRKRAFVTLKDVRKNDRIEVSYSLVGLNPVFGGKFSAEFYLGDETAVCNYFKTIITSPGRKLVVRTSNNAPAPVEELAGDRYIYHWDNPPLPIWESASGAPSWYLAYPTVEVTEYKSWQEVVNWGLGVFRNYQYPLPDDLRTRIKAWEKTAAGDQDVFANLATHFVQDEVRYLGLEIGPNTHRPHTPADVYMHRFGDCKDKALLLASILRSQGMQAYVTLISTTTRHQLPSKVPSPGDFDHAIVAIGRSANVFLYIDPTISGQRGQLVNRYIPDYGFTLILKEGEDQLRPVEPGFLYNDDVEETLDVKNYDSSKFTVSSTYAGGAADHIRRTFADYSMKELEDNYRKYYASLYDDIRMDGPITVSDDDEKDEFTVKEKYTIPEIWNTDEKGKRSVNFAAKIIDEYLPALPSNTEAGPLALSFPRTVNYTARINMPEDWGFDLTELHIKNGSFQFDFTPSISFNHITLHYYLKTFKDHIPVEDLAAYKTDHKNIMERLSFDLYQATTPSGSQPSGESPAPSRKGLTPSAGVSGIAYWPAIWFTFFFAMIFTALFRRLNVRSEEVSYPYEPGFPLGGWTIVLGIGIILGLVYQAVSLVRDDFYRTARWDSLETLGGTPLRLFFFTQLAYYLLCLASLGAIVYWFLKRRDIFPRMFTWYVGILLSGQLFLIIFLRLIPAHAAVADYLRTLIIQFIRTCIYGAVWVTYVQRSGRVKSTFLRRHDDA